MQRSRGDGRGGGAVLAGQGQAWQRYFEWGERCWAASERAFSGPLDLPGLARRQASLSDLFASAPGQTLAGLARRFFTDPRLIQYACRYATYSGSDPYQAPAAVGCIPYRSTPGGPGTWMAGWPGCGTRWPGCWPIWAWWCTPGPRCPRS